MGPTVATESFAGRDAETALLRNLVRETVLGHGQCALVEGEPGMGKSALLASVRAEAGELGCQVFAAAADELGQEFPLRAMVDCLRVADDTEDPRRAAICGRLRQECSAGVAGTGEDVVGAAEELLDLVDQACGRRPVLLVLDDLQWADRASLLVWHRLCRSAEQLPLLVLGAYRPVPHRTELDQIRRGVRARGGVVHVLGPLDHCDALRLVAARAGAASCGGELAWLADRAAGNPGYLTELADALLRDDRIRVSAGVAELSAADLGGRVPAALTTAIAGRLDFLSGQALATLRSAALLGDEFSVHDLAVVLHRPASDLLDALGEAVRAGVLAEAGSDLAFRYPLVRQALSDATPLAVRSALHREAAEALAATGAPPVLVARQLLAAADTVDEWTLGWLADTA
ncbi:MAG: AAA family ATPase [Kutzneria sp.]|nr:AAA family ATPase [Kutzneria sp.]